MKKAAILLIIALALPLFADEFPAHRGYVNDFAGMLSGEQKERLTGILGNLEKLTGVQMAVAAMNNPIAMISHPAIVGNLEKDRDLLEAAVSGNTVVSDTGAIDNHSEGNPHFSHGVYG